MYGNGKTKPQANIVEAEKNAVYAYTLYVLPLSSVVAFNSKYYIMNSESKKNVSKNHL